MENSLIYYDIGAEGGPEFPFREKKHKKFFNKYIGIDPFFPNPYVKQGKYIFYGCAVSNEEGDRTFYLTPPFKKRRLSSSLYKPNEEVSNKRGVPLISLVSTKQVKCRKLSSIIDENGGEIDFLKIDAHGSEYPILKDIESYMDEIVGIQVESWFYDCYHDVHLLDSVCDFFKKHSNFSLGMIFDEPTAFGDWACDLVYINNSTNKVDKLNLIKKLYGINEDTIAKSEGRIESMLTRVIKYGS